MDADGSDNEFKIQPITINGGDNTLTMGSVADIFKSTVIQRSRLNMSLDLKTLVLAFKLRYLALM